MKCTLLAFTPNPEQVIATAARLCYSNESIEEIQQKMDIESVSNFIHKLMEMGHLSPLEHASFTFGLEGVSRALLAQITRHRIASFSVRSQRYCKYKETISEELWKPDACSTVMAAALINAKKAYDRLLNLGAKKEDARMVLPNAAQTSLIMTMNARELLHFFNLRCCTRAQKEIREAANIMLQQVQEVAPDIFKDAGPTCRKGYCLEGKMSCGIAPTMDQLLETYNNRHSL